MIWNKDLDNYKAHANGVSAAGFILRVFPGIALAIVLGIDLEQIL